MTFLKRVEKKENSVVSKSTPVDPTLLTRGFTLLTFILVIVFIAFSIKYREYQFFLLAGLFTLDTIFSFSFYSDPKRPIRFSQMLFYTILLQTSFALTAAIFPVLGGFPFALSMAFISFLLSTLLPASQTNDLILLPGLLGGIGAIVLTALAPFPQLNLPVVLVITLIFTVILALITAYLYFVSHIFVTLRVKLVVGALALVIIPLTIIAIIFNQFLQNSIQQQSNQLLRVAGAQTATSLDNFFVTNLDTIKDASLQPFMLEYLDLPPGERIGSVQESQINSTFITLKTSKKTYAPSYALLDRYGRNLYDTEPALVGLHEGSKVFFLEARSAGTSYISPVDFVADISDSYIYFLQPIYREGTSIAGFVRIRYDAHVLQYLVSLNNGLAGTRSYPVLLDENGLRLADGYVVNAVYRTVLELTPTQFENLQRDFRLPEYLNPTTILALQPDFANIVEQNINEGFFTTNTNYAGNVIPQYGIVTTMKNQPWRVIYLQDQSPILNSLKAQNQQTIVIAAIIASIVALLLTVVANLFTGPIFQMTETAQKISAGDFNLQVSIGSTDEIGILGGAFNSMTTQLKEFIGTLENRVKERTSQLAKQNDELQYRSRQLQTVADVARGIVSTRDLPTLLNTITTLISRRFAFYHVGIFLVDEKNEYAVLRAANSEGGQRMLARQHKLAVGQVGIVGHVTSRGEPRIATDVGQDAVYFNNPDLPDTKSEMALPLAVEGRIIGALDVQSKQSDAFTEEDVNLFSTLADQVAIAINNQQLYADTAKALEESERVHRQYLWQEWTRESSEVKTQSYKYTVDGLEPITEEFPEIKTVLQTARPVLRMLKPEGGKSARSVMAVPILLRGESIGAFHLQVSDKPDFEWSESDLNTVKSVADQVALTLENTRLFENTIKRANRERRVLEITSKLRSTNDSQNMLKIALEELSASLGANKAQIVLNLKDLDHSETNNMGVNTQALSSKPATENLDPS